MALVTLVDGSHRLVKRFLTGRKSMQLWTCHEEVWSQSLIRRVGRVAIIPCPGSEG
jgi:hypothetical protein